MNTGGVDDVPNGADVPLPKGLAVVEKGEGLAAAMELPKVDPNGDCC